MYFVMVNLIAALIALHASVVSTDVTVNYDFCDR